ncbi:MAG: hypothetical protein GEU79_18775 [Acidimicrobiia bacterium]|nr:hypothetical protein [Acidimicrobiia bacterium]
MIITSDWIKIPVGLRQGDTENATVIIALLADLQERGLDASGGLLAAIDGAKALAKAVRGTCLGTWRSSNAVPSQAEKRQRPPPQEGPARIDAWLAAAFAYPDPD